MNGFYLRRPADIARPYIRRGLYLAWSPVKLLELAAKFHTREEAIAFAQEMHLVAEVELVTVSSEVING